MKSKLLGFEKAHTLLLCMLYLPIPEFIATFFFRSECITCDFLALAMIIEIMIAIVVYVSAHKCPECGVHVPQIRLHGNCNCHACGYNLLAFEELRSSLPEPETFERVDEREKEEGSPVHS